MKQTFRGAVLMKKPNSAMSAILCTGPTFVKKNFCLVAKIVSFDTVKLSNLIFLNSELFLLTFGFIASARAFNLPTRAFNLVTRAFSLLTRGSEFVNCGFELVTRGFELVILNS